MSFSQRSLTAAGLKTGSTVIFTLTSWFTSSPLNKSVDTLSVTLIPAPIVAILIGANGELAGGQRGVLCYIRVVSRVYAWPHVATRL